MCYVGTILEVQTYHAGPLIEQGLHALREDLDMVSKLFTQNQA